MTTGIPDTREVGPGIWAIAQPIPVVSSVNFTFCYLIADDRDGLHLIDPGWDSESNWERLLHELHGLGRRETEIRTATVTHLHRDHIGLSTQLQERLGTSIALHHADAAILANGGDNRWLPSMLTERLRRWQVPQTFQHELVAELGHREEPPPLEPDRTLVDGEKLGISGRNLRVVATPGHTPGHICLVEHDAGVVFTGDHILPELNPGIGLAPGDGSNPLVDYLSSLTRMETVAGAGLPAHQHALESLPLRIQQIRAHHLDRAAAVARLADAETALSIWDIASLLTWHGGWDALDAYSRHSALAQTEMHLNRLRSEQPDRAEQRS